MNGKVEKKADPAPEAKVAKATEATQQQKVIVTKEVTTTTETVQKRRKRETRPHLLDLLLDGLEGAAIVALRDLLPCLREPVHRGRKALYTAARASRTFRLDDPPLPLEDPLIPLGLRMDVK